MEGKIIKGNKKDMGRIFVLVGIVFFILSFSMPISTILWGVFLGISIILNIVGAVIVSQSLWKSYN